jgi:hypothetical protein
MLLPGAVAFQSLQPVSGRRAQKIQRFSRVELGQLANRHARNARQSPALAALEQGLRISAAEALDHVLQNITLNVKRQIRDGPRASGVESVGAALRNYIPHIR